MGEIADALRRARDERGGRDDERPQTGGRPVADSPVYSRAVELQPPGTRFREPAEPVHREPEVEISRERRGDWAARTVVVEHEGGRAESYRHFAIRLAREMERKRLRSVMLVSALRLEGKTTTACNLALAYASMSGGRHTALVDFDLRRPRIGRALGIEPRTGLETVLDGRAALSQACLRTDLSALDVYPVASPLGQPHEVLAHPRIRDVFAELEHKYDTVVIDSAPLLLVPDAELLFSHVGGAVAVLRARKTKREAFRRMVEMIPEGKLLGSFLNDHRATRHSKQYGYYSADGRRAQPQST